MAILNYITTAVLFYFLGIASVFVYAFIRGRKATWDDSNIINAIRFVSHVVLHPDDFTQMYYKDGSKPFWYLDKDCFKEVVKSRPKEIRWNKTETSSETDGEA